MQAFNAETLETLRHFHWVIRINGLCVVVSLSETYALAVDDVYSWYQFNHIFLMSKKFCNILAPTFPLFSGWNWAEKKLSLCRQAL